MFSEDFVWGVADSACQVEGRTPGDGSGASVWDAYCDAGGVYEGHRIGLACDRVHRYKEDFAMMKAMGVKNYRFSVSWPRILPNGIGEVNPEGIAYYKDMIREMKKNGIEPYFTMFHWEYPQALQEKGGWLNPESVEWFAEYARVIAENFSEDCTYFFTMNEPQCFVGLGHLSGVHAPGLKLSYKDTFQIAHNALKAHGAAVINLRKYAKKPILVGYAPTCSVQLPATESPEDIEAARECYFGFTNPMSNWTWNVAWFSDPVFLGKYPEEGLKKFAEYLPEITEEDMKLISQPLDFMGQNVYNGNYVRRAEDGSVEYLPHYHGFPKSSTQWPVTPECLYWSCRFLYERYHMPIYITENGMACHDYISMDGRVHDADRINFLDRYIAQVQRAVDEGIGIKGFFLWTFMDNFEWDCGYNQRFGIIYVDFRNQKRIVKDSAYWYREVILSNGRSLSVNNPSKELMYFEQKERMGDSVFLSGRYTGMTIAEVYKEYKGEFGYLPCEKMQFNESLTGSACYKFRELNVADKLIVSQEYPFMILNVTEGNGIADGHFVKKGDKVFVPNAYGEITLLGDMKITAATVAEE